MDRHAQPRVRGYLRRCLAERQPDGDDTPDPAWRIVDRAGRIADRDSGLGAVGLSAVGHRDCEPRPADLQRSTENQRDAPDGRRAGRRPNSSRSQTSRAGPSAIAWWCRTRATSGQPWTASPTCPRPSGSWASTDGRCHSIAPRQSRTWEFAPRGWSNGIRWSVTSIVQSSSARRIPTGFADTWPSQGQGASSRATRQFEDLGRTTIAQLGSGNQKGRYAVHLHYLDGEGVVEGNSIVNASKWPLTVHHSHNKTLRGNVILGGSGAGVMTETGHEVGNVFAGNLVIGVDGDGGRGDEGLNDGRGAGINGSGFWLHPGSITRDNGAYNSRFYGFCLVERGRDQRQPLSETIRNEAIANQVGVTVWGPARRPSTASLISCTRRTAGIRATTATRPRACICATGSGAAIRVRRTHRAGWRTKGSGLGITTRSTARASAATFKAKTPGSCRPMGCPVVQAGGTRVFSIVDGLLAGNRKGLGASIGIAGAYDPGELPPHVYHVSGTRFANNGTHISHNFAGMSDANAVALQRLNVTNYNGTGESFVGLRGRASLRLRAARRAVCTELPLQG